MKTVIEMPYRTKRLPSKTAAKWASLRVAVATLSNAVTYIVSRESVKDSKVVLETENFKDALEKFNGIVK